MTTKGKSVHGIPVLSVDPGRIAKSLARLGNSAEGIAESLTSRRIHGTRSGGSCPVARYLRREFEDASISVRADRIVTPTDVIPLSRGMQTFIARFDAKMYPDILELEPWEVIDGKSRREKRDEKRKKRLAREMRKTAEDSEPEDDE